MSTTARRVKSIERKVAEMEPPESIKIVRTFICPERGMVSAMFQGIVMERSETESADDFEMRVEKFAEMELSI